MVRLNSWLNNCSLETSTSNPVVCIVELDIICKGNSEVGPTYKEWEQEIMSHIIDRLLNKNDNILPVIEDQNALSVHVIQEKIWNFWNRVSRRRRTIKRLLCMHQISNENVVNAGNRGTGQLIVE